MLTKAITFEFQGTEVVVSRGASAINLGEEVVAQPCLRAKTDGWSISTVNFTVIGTSQFAQDICRKLKAPMSNQSEIASGLRVLVRAMS